MFKAHRGICSCGCGKEGIVCVKKGYIQECNHRIKNEKKVKSGKSISRIFTPKTEEEKQEIFNKLKERFQAKQLKQNSKKRDSKLSMFYNPNASRKTFKPLKRTALKKKFPKKTGEGEVFTHIWNTREHKCEVCDAPIKRVNGGVGMFSHILSKGSYVDMRLDEENILLMGDGLYDNCDCHPVWEIRTAEMRNIEMWRPIFLLQDALKRKANVTNKGKE